MLNMVSMLLSGIVLVVLVAIKPAARTWLAVVHIIAVLVMTVAFVLSVLFYAVDHAHADVLDPPPFKYALTWHADIYYRDGDVFLNTLADDYDIDRGFSTMRSCWGYRFKHAPGIVSHIEAFHNADVSLRGTCYKVVR